jgi:hypothetical protein
VIPRAGRSGVKANRTARPRSSDCESPALLIVLAIPEY